MRDQEVPKVVVPAEGAVVHLGVHGASVNCGFARGAGTGICHLAGEGADTGVRRSQFDGGDGCWRRRAHAGDDARWRPVGVRAGILRTA